MRAGHSTPSISWRVFDLVGLAVLAALLVFGFYRMRPTPKDRYRDVLYEGPARPQSEIAMISYAAESELGSSILFKKEEVFIEHGKSVQVLPGTYTIVCSSVANRGDRDVRFSKEFTIEAQAGYQYRIHHQGFTGPFYNKTSKGWTVEVKQNE
jgi:hypothetical protein